MYEKTQNGKAVSLWSRGHSAAASQLAVGGGARVEAAWDGGDRDAGRGAESSLQVSCHASGRVAGRSGLDGGGGGGVRGG